MSTDEPHGVERRQDGRCPRDPWHRLEAATPARIAIGRSGNSLPTREVLSFSLAHAQARDAVHAPFDRDALVGPLEALGLDTLLVESRAPDKPRFLRRPDLGRRLSPESLRCVEAAADPEGCDLALVIAEGLSATAVATNSVALVTALHPHVEHLGLKLSPVVLALGARVALGDEVGAALGARMVAVLIGERPGLSSPDGLSVYLTLGPGSDRTDADRNCISNIRDDGLAPVRAAATLAWLMEQALRLGQTGVALKDESEEAALLTS